MSKSGNERKLTSAQQARLDRALIRLVGSTRRGRRIKNLLDVAHEIKVAEKLLGSRKALAREVGLSGEMLREFASVQDLQDPVRDLIERGALTSVDTAYRISMLPEADQVVVANAYVSGQLSGKDVRDVVRLRAAEPKMPIRDLVERVRSAKTIKEYMVRLRLADRVHRKRLRERLEGFLGHEHVRSVDMNGNIVTLVVDEEAKTKIQNQARKRRLTKRELVRLVIEGER